ncbi:hypothetical protein PMAYCL1PPCAC_00052, partial [Pristionchus mayeri]
TSKSRNEQVRAVPPVEVLIALPGESPLLDKILPLRKIRPAGKMSPPSSFIPTDDHSAEMKALCQSTGALSLEDTKINQSAIIHPRWDSLPWPAVDRLFHFLLADIYSRDVCNLSQIAGLLSTSIKHVEVGDFMRFDFRFSLSAISLCAKLLRGSTIDKLVIIDPTLDDITGPLILSIASRGLNHLYIRSSEISGLQLTQLSDPAAFIKQLKSLPIIHVAIKNSDSLLNIHRDFWRQFLNEELSNGSIEWVRIGDSDEKIHDAPVDIPHSPLSWLEWVKSKAK